ncbi:MAG: hypothetical protein JSW71_05410 [Gemmatimonadota bacterium]|nr:MAG: hypothetical protein JSW71_05410 [Gemmatimonadota bacterium]
MSNDEDIDWVNTGVLALQGFLSREDEARIIPLCLRVSEIEGFDGGLNRGASRLHMTLASWKVTPQEVQLAQSQFASRFNDLAAITMPVSLFESRGNGGLACAIAPKPTEALLQWHAQVHAKVAWPFQPWREMDLPGSWWPHIGVCHIAESKEHLASEPLQKLREIEEITIERIGLVSYFGSMQVLGEVELRREATL